MGVNIDIFPDGDKLPINIMLLIANIAVVPIVASGKILILNC